MKQGAHRCPHCGKALVPTYQPNPVLVVSAAMGDAIAGPPAALVGAFIGLLVGLWTHGT